MFSDNFRLADPEYIDFVPKTVQEAILKFRRLQAKGLEAWMFPEALIKCGAELPEEEATKFENWMINPTGEPDKNAVDVRDFMKAQALLDKKHGREPEPREQLPACKEEDDACKEEDEKVAEELE